MASKKRFKKITEHRKQFIQSEVDRYSKQIGISENQRPKVILTSREVKEMPIELTEGRRTSAYYYYGVCYYRARTIFINAKKLHTTKELRNTIVHELVHYRFNYLSHGNKFRQRVREILQGRQFSIKNIAVE